MLVSDILSTLCAKLQVSRKELCNVLGLAHTTLNRNRDKKLSELPNSKTKKRLLRFSALVFGLLEQSIDGKKIRSEVFKKSFKSWIQCDTGTHTMDIYCAISMVNNDLREINKFKAHYNEVMEEIKNEYEKFYIVQRNG